MANEDVVQTLEDTVVTGNVLNNDVEPDGDSIILNQTPLLEPDNGTVVLNPDGSFTYTPNPGFTGMDTFCYEICDDAVPSLCDTACVIIDVLPEVNDTLNDAPFAQDDANSTVVNIPVSGDMSPNDVDPNGDSLVYNTVPVTVSCKWHGDHQW